MAFSNKNLFNSLSSLAKQVEGDLKTNAPKDTGALSNSIKAVKDDNGFTVSMLEYGPYVDKGVNGVKQSQGSPFSFTNKMPPTSAFKTAKSPFAVAKSIFNKGIKPQPFIEKSTDTIDFDLLLEGYGEDIDEELKKHI